jgi:hypothetical protein
LTYRSTETREMNKSKYEFSLHHHLFQLEFK